MKPCMCTLRSQAINSGQAFGQQTARTTDHRAPRLSTAHTLLTSKPNLLAVWLQPSKKTWIIGELTWKVSRSVAGGVLQGESSGAMSVHSLSKFSTLSTCPTRGRNGDDTSPSRSFVQLSDLHAQRN